jgi:hypothetical protein
MLPKHFWLSGVMSRLAPALAAAVVLLAGRAAPLPAQNLVNDPDFVTGLNGWHVIGQVTWDGTLDAEGAPNEGSAKEVFDAPTVSGIDTELFQCVPLTVGTTYHLGGKIYIPNGNTAEGGAFFVLVPFPTADCSGPPPPGPIVQTPEVTAVGTWNDSSTTFTNSFAKSGELNAVLAPETGGRLQANVDDVVIAPGAVTCTPDPHTLCLLASRFRIAVTFETDNGNPTNAQAVPIGDSGYFWFFNAANVEAFVKMIDGCGLGGHFWFFAAGLTDVHVVMTVTDTQTGTIQVYTNPAHTAFQPVQDTSAFACP